MQVESQTQADKHHYDERVDVTNFPFASELRPIGLYYNVQVSYNAERRITCSSKWFFVNDDKQIGCAQADLSKVQGYLHVSHEIASAIQEFCVCGGGSYLNKMLVVSRMITIHQIDVDKDILFWSLPHDNCSVERLAYNAEMCMWTLWHTLCQ